MCYYINSLIERVIKMGDTFVFKNKDGNVAGTITIYKSNLKIGKIKSLESKYQEFKMLIKTSQFVKLDELLNNALARIVDYLKDTTDSTQRLKLQNKYDGLNNVKRKIELAKKEYNNNPKNQLAYNKVINLYNSLKNLL